MPFDKPFRLDFPQEIQKLLRPADGKRRNHQIAAAVERALNEGHKLFNIINPLAVASVAVGAFHHNEIRFVQILRVADNRLVCVTDVAGKHDFLCFAVFGDGQFRARRAEQMPRVDKAHPNALEQGLRRVIFTGDKLLHRVLRVLHRVKRHGRFFARTLRFAVAPLGFKLLNVGGVLEHNRAKPRGGDCRINPPFKAVRGEQRQFAGMVNVRVGQHHAVDFPGRYGQIGVLISVGTLFKPAVNQNPFAARLQKRTAAGHFVGSA